jgi:type IV pilus assembly protein PilY1
MKVVYTGRPFGRINRFTGRLSLRFVTVLLVSVVLVGSVYADDEEFSNDTMETRVTSPPPNIMFVLDNSGSMDWSFMAPESSGKFHNTAYLWGMGDNAYSSFSTNGKVSKELEWQGQWAGYNRIFYNPHSSYIPWPRWNQSANTEGRNGVLIKSGGTYPAFNADLKEPRSNPVDKDYTLKLHDTYVNIKNNKGLYIHVKNAHYYMVDDTNGDGKPQYGEVYLVNFEWTDRDSDGNVDEGEVLRHYYLVSYDNDSGNHEDVTSLKEVNYNPAAEYDANTDSVPDNVDEVPDSIQPITYSDSQKRDIFVSDLEDLQNFANWFSFYRRRALTAKAAVSRTISELDNVYVGYNTMHRVVGGGGAKQPVLPIDVYESVLSGDSEIIIDNTGSGFTKSGQFSYQSKGGWVTEQVTKWVTNNMSKDDTSNCKDYAKDVLGYKNKAAKNYCKKKGNPYKVQEQVWDPNKVSQAVMDSWVEASRSGEYRKSSLKTQDNDLSSDPDKWAKFTPNIQETGLYKVSAWWPCSVDADEKAKVTVEHKLGTETKYYNQKASSNDTVSQGSCTDSGDTGCCGYWIDLGGYYFDQGQAGSVEIRRHSGSTDAITAADAIRFKLEGVVNTAKVDQSEKLLDVLYQITSGDGTPLRQTLQEVGKYYDQDDGSTGGIGDCPYLSVDEGGACQQAYAIAMTDGFWNGSSPNVGNKDGGKGSPYEDSYDNTLADVAMRYYDTDLAGGLLDEMSTNPYDKQKTQHMVTFSVSFGLDGTIDLTDIDGNGVLDNPGYADDPYFLDTDTPRPKWPKISSDSSSTIDDLWHASVNGRGKYFSAKDPDTLVAALQETFADIGSRKASGASVSVNGDELSNGLVLYQSSYESGVWKGNVTAYPIDPNTGEIKRQEDEILWHVQAMLAKQDWDTGRNLFTFDGTQGVPFRYNKLSQAQQDALSLDNKSGEEVVKFLRGGTAAGNGFRERGDTVLGDLVHSAPLLVSAVDPEKDGIDNDGDGQVDETDPQETGGTLYVGGNDGMLHAFNAETGVERFAYFPLRSFDYLFDLTKADYEHRYYVDGRQHFKRLKFFAGDQSTDRKDNNGNGLVDDASEKFYSDGVDNDGDGDIDEPFEYKTITLLVGTLNKGGRGIYALDISEAESTVAGSNEASTAEKMVMWEYPPMSPDGMAYASVGKGANADNSDGFDDDGDGAIDEEGEMALANILLPAENDSIDNDNDGVVDEAGEVKQENRLDPDMGYTFGDALIARSYITKNEGYNQDDHPWVVIFANGYESRNGQAVLYILDALTGRLLRKITTGPSGNNGLSSPAIIDIDNDDRVDFVYAGDLKGNMWKFDLRDPDPENWGVMYGTDSPKPLINVGRPITTAPDVAYHCEANGYVVVFGTGKFLGANDVDDNSQQGIFGIWDFGNNPTDYLGDWQVSDNSFPAPGLPELKDVQLLEQVEIDWGKYYGSYLRTLSDYEPDWSVSASGVPSGDVGWFFDLPYNLGLDELDNDGDGQIDEDDEANILAGERVVKDVFIRNGLAVVISLIPGNSPCDGGGNSIVHEMPFCSGGRLTEPVFDINNDGLIDERDRIEINGESLPPNGMMYDGILHKPVVVGDPDEEKDRELKIFSSSNGTTQTLWEKQEETGFYYWKEH